MKKTAIITSILWATLIWALGLAPSTFASETGESQRPTWTMNMTQDSIVSFINMTVRVDIKQYLDADMTDEEREELQAAIKAHMEESQELRKSIREAVTNWEDTDDLEDEYFDHLKEGLDMFDNYIADDMEDEWEDVKSDYLENIEEAEVFRQENKEDREGIREGFQWIKDNWLSFYEDNGKIKDYLDADLSDEEKEELLELKKEWLEEIKEIMVSIKEAKENGDDVADLLEELIDAKKDSLDALDPYIADDMEDKWKVFKDNFIETVDSNNEYRVTIVANSQEIRERISEKRQSAIDNALERLDKILWNLDGDKLETVLDKLDAKITKLRDNIDNSNASDDKKEELHYILDEIEDVMDKYRDGNEDLDIDLDDLIDV